MNKINKYANERAWLTDQRTNWLTKILLSNAAWTAAVDSTDNSFREWVNKLKRERVTI